MTLAFIAAGGGAGGLRDMLVMTAMSLSLFVIGHGFRGLGRINRIEGAVLLVCYVGYTAEAHRFPGNQAIQRLLILRRLTMNNPPQNAARMARLR
jgi:hypothetical protein